MKPIEEGLALGIPADDWQIIVQAHPHLIVEQVESSYDRTIVSLTPYLRQPIAAWHPGDPLAWPEPRHGTLVLHHAGRLPIEDQRTLLDWMEGRGGETQVVGLTSLSLLGAVRAGTFSAELYYRLNVVCLKLR